MIRATIVALFALNGCAVDLSSPLESAECGQREVATSRPAGDWPCWAPNKGGHCVFALNSRKACDGSDELFHSGDVVHMYCALLEAPENDERFLVPVFCDDGTPAYDANGKPTR